MTSNKSILMAIGLIIGLLSLALFAVPAKAIEYENIGLQPANPRQDVPRSESIIVHTLSPGQTQAEAVNVVNNTTEQKVLRVYGADHQTSSGGGFACKQAGENNSLVGTWINVDSPIVTVAPNSQERVDFTISVPTGLAPGEYNGCLALEEAKMAGAPNQAGINLSVRMAMRVAITIPGAIVKKVEIKDLDVAGIEWNRHSLALQIQNSGSVSVDGNVNVDTTNLFGRHFASNEGTYPFLPADIKELNYELPASFWGGWFKSTATLAYDPSLTSLDKTGTNISPQDTASLWFFYTPSTAALFIEIGLLLVILALIIWFILAMLRKRKTKKEWQSYAVQPGDELESLAQVYQVSWKKIAKANKLKPPYKLKPGDNLLLPPVKKQ